MSSSMLWLVVAAQITASAAAPLTPQQTSTVIDRVVPAYEHGQPTKLVKSLSPLVAKLDEAGLEAVDELLAEREIPPVAQLLAKARLTLVEQKLNRKLPRPSHREVLFILPSVRRELSETRAIVDAHPAMAEEPLAIEGFDNLETMFRRADVLASWLETARVLGEYAGTLSRKVPPRVRATLADTERENLQFDYKAAVKNIDQSLWRLEQRVALLRIDRLERAAEILRKREMTAERIVAAYWIAEDGAALADFFKNNKRRTGGETLEERLSDPRLPDRLRKTTRLGEGLAGGLVRKSRLLFSGLHWWKRGRYGQGPSGEGLLKSAAAAGRPLVEHVLDMPEDTPRPTDPRDSESGSIPLVDRRHHYTWAWENRGLERRQITKPVAFLNVTPRSTISETPEMRDGPVVTRRYRCNSLKTVQVTTRVPTGRIIRDSRSWYQFDRIMGLVHTTQSGVSNQDPRLVARLVGFLEYRNALENFDALLSIASPDELKAIDELVSSRDELAVYTNLSRLVERKDSSLSEKGEHEDDRFERRGLAWVMALARVELGAMLAGFTDQAAPFEMVRPSRLERSAYQELLEDGMRTHVWTLRNDPELPRVVNGSVSDRKLLSYGRRVAVARAIHRAVGKIRTDASRKQRAEWSAWGRQLEARHRAIVSHVQQLLAKMNETDRRMTRSNLFFAGQGRSKTDRSRVTFDGK